MNPFNLAGLEFLLFYLILCSVVIVALVRFRRTAESGAIPKTSLSDPYLIAYLRGGKNETLRVAMLSLIDRKLLTVNNQTVQTAENVSPNMVSIPLEQGMLTLFAKASSASSIYLSPTLESACLRYENRLKQDGLLPDDQTKVKRFQRLVMVSGIILGVGFARIVQSLVTGHYNLSYLIMMMVVAVIIARAYYSPRLTQRGKDFLEDIQTLYAHLKNTTENPQHGSASTDSMILTAAVYGIGAITTYSTLSYAHTLFPGVRENSSVIGSSCSSSCGSSCSSSSSSSCSSGGSSCSSGSSCGGGCGGGGGCGS
jgi:uncharacterized protein (TIGR04222 family)